MYRQIGTLLDNQTMYDIVTVQKVILHKKLPGNGTFCVKSLNRRSQWPKQ